MATDPAAINEMGHDSGVDAAGRSHVDIFDTGLLPQGGDAQPCGQALCRPHLGLPINQQAEPFLEAEGVKGRCGLPLFVQRLGHALEAKGLQTIRCGVYQQGVFSFQW